MANLTDLREQMARAATEARSLLDQAFAEKDPARAADLETQHDRAMADFDAISAKVERAEKLEAVERSMTRPDPRRPVLTGEGRGTDEGGKPDYRTVFAKVVCGVSPVDLSGEERAVLAVGSAKFEARAQTAGTTTAGGYTVPTELMNIIDKAMLAWGPMYNAGIVTDVVTAAGNPMKLPTVDDTTVTAVAHTEGTALTDDGGSDVTFGQKSLDAYAFDTEFVRWSWELDTDSIFNMESLLGGLLGERLGRIANLQLTTGTGSSAPNGIVTASSLGKTSASATAITADEIIDLLHSVDPAYRASPKAAFMCNDSTIKAIRKLKDGQGNYLWQMGDFQAGIPANILAHPVYVNQAMASIPASASASKVMLFGDFSRYYVRKVGAPVIGVMRERFWPDLGIAGLIRFDGELSQSGAVKHLITAAS